MHDAISTVWKGITALHAILPLAPRIPKRNHKRKPVESFVTGSNQEDVEQGTSRYIHEGAADAVQCKSYMSHTNEIAQEPYMKLYVTHEEMKPPPTLRYIPDVCSKP